MAIFPVVDADSVRWWNRLHVSCVWFDLVSCLLLALRAQLRFSDANETEHLTF